MAEKTPAAPITNGTASNGPLPNVHPDSIDVAAPPPAYAPAAPSKDEYGAQPDQRTTYQSAPQMQATPQPAAHGAMVTNLTSLGEVPAQVDCPNCHRRTMTRVQKTDTTMTIILGVALGFFCICLACLPCIMHCYNDIDHFCESCGAHLTHSKEGGPSLPVDPNAGRVVSQYPAAGGIGGAK